MPAIVAQGGTSSRGAEEKASCEKGSEGSHSHDPPSVEQCFLEHAADDPGVVSPTPGVKKPDAANIFVIFRGLDSSF